jgi:plastocyanin
MLLLGVFLTTGAWAQVQYEAKMVLSLKDLYDVKTDFHGIKVPYEYSDPSQQVTVEVTTIKGGQAYLSSQCGRAASLVDIDTVLLYKLVQVSPSPILTHSGEQMKFLKKAKTHRRHSQQYGLCDKEDSSSPKFWKNQAIAADGLIYGKDPDGWWNWGANNVTVKILITLTGVPYSAIQQLRIPGLGDVALSHFKRVDSHIPLTVKVYRSDNTTPIFSQAYNNDAVGSGLGLRMGDSVVFESPYPELLISGLADTWIARTAGESKYYCTPSIKMGGFRPFLGYDSKVHGVGMRKYPDGFDPNYPSLKVSNGNFSTYWIAQRHTSADAEEYDPFNIENGNVAFSKVKDASDFGRDNFPIGGNESVTAQRNNQREGYNMQILDRFFTAMGGDPTDKSLADYAGLDLGGNYVAGLDGDELLYLNHKYARFNQQGEDDAITKLSVESWKKLWNANGGWESRDDDAVNWMVQTYQSNRMALLQGNDAFEYQKYVDRYSDHSTIYNGHEILDKEQYVYDPLELNPQAYFNHKRPVIHTPGGSAIPEKGKISWGDGINTHEFPLDVLFPSPYTLSFYGAIKGDRYPSRGQQNVFYRISKSIIDNQVAEGIYQLEYTFEDELGFLTKDVVNLSNSNGRRIIVGSKIGANFNIQGGGYHEITLTYRRNADASSVIIAGRELRVVDLRFVSAPGTKEAGDFAKDGSIFIANDALDLKEGRGDGKNWYLRERVAQTAADVNGYGDTDYGVTRTYVLAKGDRVVFNAIDADPHTFRHYDVEWYLSQRLMSKCLTDEELESRIAWTLSGPSQANGTGRHYAHTFETAGEYTLEATYGGTSTVKHKIIVHEAPYVNTPESEKGKIVFYDLSDVQKEWLREFTGSPDLDLSEAKVAKVQDIYSKYSYDEGPRAPGNNPENRENRYGPQNDFNASFAWTVPKCANLYYIGNMVLDAVEECSVDNQPEYFPDPYLDEFEPASSWFPKNWIRHFSDKPYPNDINSGLITDPESAVSSHWPEDVFEPWMWRLPWISRTQWHGYRTRWNIKAVYDMKRLFNDDLGAFSGEKFHLTDNPDAYRREVYGQPVSGGGYDGTKIVAGLDDTARKKYDFFWDLYAGRKLIIDATELHGPEHRRFEVRLINPADDNFTFIAAKIYGDPLFCDGPCPISPPLVRHLFDNNYEDASGNNISSVPQNNPGFVSNTAQGSRALLLSQTNYVDLDVNNAFIHDAFNERTVAFWVYSVQNIASITEDLYDEGGATHGIAIRKQGTTLELAVRNNRQQRTISSCFYRDEWIHVAGVFDNGKLQLYINGQLQAENPDVGYSSIPAHGNGAGFGKTNGENAFDQVSVGLFGAMDDLQVYGRALTADEVQYLVAQADITPDPDLCGTNSALSGSGGSSQVGEIGIVSLDVPANESLKVYPNPSADGNFVVTFDLPASATVGLEVSALDGRRLMTKSLNKLVAGQHRLQIEETQGLPPGMYLLKVDFGDHVEARKLVISN